MRLLWSGGRFLGEFLLDARGKGLDAFDVGGGSPEFLVGIPLAVGEHAGAANAVLSDPEDLGFGILSADFGELRNRREQTVWRTLRIRRAGGARPRPFWPRTRAR